MMSRSTEGKLFTTYSSIRISLRFVHCIIVFHCMAYIVPEKNIVLTI